MEKKSRSRRELKNIKDINNKASNKRIYYSSNSSSSDSDSDSSFYIYIYWQELRQTTELKETNELDHVVTNIIRKNKNQHNDAFEYEPKFDIKITLSREAKETLPVATVSLRRGKK